VALSWAPSTSTGVTGYNVYRATTSGAYGTTPINASPLPGTTYTDTTVVAGQTYFYVATAVDAGGQSIDSNQAPAIIP
jgi:fibronectin type 3 domain-containing protein